MAHYLPCIRPYVANYWACPVGLLGDQIQWALTTAVSQCARGVLDLWPYGSVAFITENVCYGKGHKNIFNSVNFLSWMPVFIILIDVLHRCLGIVLVLISIVFLFFLREMGNLSKEKITNFSS